MPVKVMSPCNKKQNRFIAPFGRRKIRVTSGIRNGSTFKILSHKPKGCPAWLHASSRRI